MFAGLQPVKKQLRVFRTIMLQQGVALLVEIDQRDVLFFGNGTYEIGINLVGLHDVACRIELSARDGRQQNWSRFLASSLRNESNKVVLIFRRRGVSLCFLFYLVV